MQSACFRDIIWRQRQHDLLLREFEVWVKKRKWWFWRVEPQKQEGSSSFSWNRENCKKSRFGGRVGIQFWYFKLAMYVIYPSEFVKHAARWTSEVQKWHVGCKCESGSCQQVDGIGSYETTQRQQGPSSGPHWLWKARKTRNNPQRSRDGLANGSGGRTLGEYRVLETKWNVSRRRERSTVSKATERLNKMRNENQLLTRDWEVRKHSNYVYTYFKKFS